MIAFEITCVATSWKRIVVGESSKSCPLFERDEWLNDRGASFGLNADGGLVAYQWGEVLDASGVFTICRASMPEWVKGHQHKQEEVEMAKPYTKEMQLGKGRKKAAPKTKASGNGAVAKSAKKPKSRNAPKAGLWKLIEKKAGKEAVILEGSRPGCYNRAKSLGVGKPTSKDWRKGKDAEYILRPAKTLLEQTAPKK